MIFNRFSNLAVSAVIVLAVACSNAPAWCGEVVSQEQNLALLKKIEANLAKKPGDVTFQLQHAEMMGRLQRYDEQVAEANRMLKQKPKLREAYLLRAYGEGNLNQSAAAITSLDKAFALGAPTPKLLLLKAKHLKSEKRYQEAIDLLKLVIAAEPSNVTAYDCRSFCFFRLHGPCEQALQDMEKVVLLNPNDAEAKALVANLRRVVRGKASLIHNLSK